MTALLAVDPDNPRSIDEASAAGLDASLRAFGDLSGVVWNRRTRQLVAGHQRLGRLEAAGATLEANADGEPARIVDPRTGEVFRVRVVDWPIERQRAANLAANNPRIAGEFTAAALPQLAALADLPAFAPLRLDALRDDLAPLAAVAVVEDEAPPAPAVATSRRGDLWTLGTHRLLCGDSTKAADVARLMGGERIDCVVTDPPYGMKLDTDWSGIRGTVRSLGFQKRVRGKAYAPVIGDDKPFDPSPLFALWSAPEMFLFGADYYAENIPERTNGSWLVWDKRKESQADGFGSEFELIWSRTKHKRRLLRHEWFGFLRAGEHGERRTHPTQKPIALIADILTQWGGALVADPYVGSGTTIIAAEQLGRRCFAMEIAPVYVDVAVLRWQALTKREATLDGDGRTFAQVRDARTTEAA